MIAPPTIKRLVTTVLKNEAISRLMTLMEKRFLVAKTLAKEYELDFLHLTIFYINSLHHDRWNDKVVERAWELIDRNIGVLISEFKDCNFIIMSDHGTNEINQVFYINSWLEKQGYLKTSGSLWFPRLLYRLGLNEQRLFAIAQKLHLNSILKRVAPKKLRNNIPSAIGTMELGQKRIKLFGKKAGLWAVGKDLYIFFQITLRCERN